MRPSSVASAKGTRRSNRNEEKPREGTGIRKIYDRLLEHAGYEIEMDFREDQLSYLMNQYGLDIIRVKRRSFKRNIQPTCMLAGLWDGKVYIDFVASKLK